MTLISKNIQLRALEPTDISVLYDWENKAENWLDSQTLHPYSKQLLNQLIENATITVFEAKQLRLMIVLKESENAIGCIDLFDVDVKNSRAGVGILIGEEFYKNRGYASEALQLIIQYAFENLNLKQLYAEVIQNNKASHRLFEKNNFEKTAIKKDWIQLNRKFLNVSLYQIFNQDL